MTIVSSCLHLCACFRGPRASRQAMEKDRLINPAPFTRICPVLCRNAIVSCVSGR